jgi:hypothetical protein
VHFPHTSVPVTKYHAMKTYIGCGGIAPHILNPSTRSTRHCQLPAPANLSPRKDPSIRWVGPEPVCTWCTTPPTANKGLVCCMFVRKNVTTKTKHELASGGGEDVTRSHRSTTQQTQRKIDMLIAVTKNTSYENQDVPKWWRLQDMFY